MGSAPSAAKQLEDACPEFAGIGVLGPQRANLAYELPLERRVGTTVFADGEVRVDFRARRFVELPVEVVPEGSHDRLAVGRELNGCGHRVIIWR